MLSFLLSSIIHDKVQATNKVYYVGNKTKGTRRRQQTEEKVPICEEIHPSIGSASSNTNKDGTPIWGKRHVEGPGVWVSCALRPPQALQYNRCYSFMFIFFFLGVKGKEKQTVGEVYELFESVTTRHICILLQSLTHNVLR